MSIREESKNGENAVKRVSVAILFLSFIKFLVGILSGSVALISDAFHSISDFITSFSSWLGFRIAQRKPSEKFPYGYYKAETLVAFFISLFIVYVAIQLLLEGYTSTFTKRSLNLPLIALLMALISSVASFFIASYENRIEKYKFAVITNSFK